MNRTLKIAIALMFLLMCSCATVTGGRQRIKVVSEPEGAEIIHEGQSLGFTPKYVEVKRRYRSILELKFSDGQTQNYIMKAGYRWADSGASNLVWSIWGNSLFPIGLGIDFLSEAAWSYNPLGVLQGPEGAKSLKTRTRVIAIAPPQSGYEILSDEIGDLIEKVIKEKFPTDTVLSYRSTAGIFERFDYSYKITSPDKFRDDLYDELQVDYIVESTVEKSGALVFLAIDVNDVFRDGTIMQLREQIPVAALEFERRGIFSKFFGSMSTVIPNTGGLDFTTSRPAVRVDSGVPEKPFLSERLADEGALKYLSSISIRTIRGNTYVHRFSFVFDWSTVVSVSYQNIKFDGEPEPNPLKNFTYSWWNTQVGVGPQVGLSSPIGYFYFEIVPVFSTSFISWRTSGNDHQVNSAFIGLKSELGYSFFLGKSLNIRWTVTTSDADERQWTAVVERSTGQRRQVKGPTIVNTGITLGYFFPEGRAAIRSIF